MAKRALVIGGTGLVGSGVAQQLLQHGWEVTSLARGNKASSIPQMKLLHADRADPRQVAQVAEHRFDLVVDCAAFKAADAQSAADAFAGHIGHYVFISTDYVYASTPDILYPVTEDAPKQTEGDYPMGKLACEAVLQTAWKHQQFPCTILRPPHVLGAGKPVGCDLVQGRDPNILDLIRNGELKLLLDGQLLIQPVYHREIGDCIAHVAGQRQSFGQIFNMMSPQCVTTRKYYQIIADRLGVALRYTSITPQQLFEHNPGARLHTRHRIYDTTRLTRTTGYAPHWPLEKAIYETLDWMQQAKA